LLTFLVYALLAINSVVAIALPWVGVVSAYLVTMLTPQNIWWWAFEDLRAQFWVVIPAIIGAALAALRGKLDFSRLNTRTNWCVITLWLCLTNAYYFGPFVDVVNQYRFFEPEWMFSTVQKTFLLYLVAVLVLDDTRKLKWAALVLVVTTVYMTYWANAQYLFHGHFGRLQGPMPLSGQSIYADENVFAVLFVVGFPFLFYFGQYLRNKMLSWGMLAVILLSWHAIFLTASRGALVGVAAILLLYVLRAKSKVGGIIIVAAFALAFAFQAGDVMKERSRTITEYETETSASQRLDAWAAAIAMMKDHPISGVGLASFGQAFPSYSDKKPKIAHNTFFQIGAEWGVIAAGAYIMLMLATINRLRKAGNALREKTEGEAFTYYCLTEACMLGLVGFFVCSMFLSLEYFEVLYFLLALSNGVLLGAKRLLPDESASQKKAIPRLRRKPAQTAHGEVR
jgi:probable O-glycosylation ligase (exosortase A-associated)